MESLYLLFKARHSRRIDWGAKALNVAMGAALILKYLQLAPWRARPPHNTFGEYCSPRKLWTD